jgi:dTDP-4-dehydrorhamnose 3,5-epimerase
MASDQVPLSTIAGVMLQPLTTYPDARGFFREIIRVTDKFFPEGFAQWSHSKMGRNTVKAWHYHHLQVDWWYCPIGVIETVLYDLREESPTCRSKMVFKLGEPELDNEALSAVVRIPQGVIHGCKVLQDPSHLFYVTSRTYDPQDEGRYPFDSDAVPHFWGEPDHIVTSERDKRVFVPPYERVPLK